MEHNFTISGDILELSLKGKLTSEAIKTFDHLLEKISKKTFKKLVIDLNKVDFIDSAALGSLLLVRDQCQNFSIELALKNPQGQVRHMFDISRFYDLFTIL